MTKKMPDNAKFPVPPVDTVLWDDQDWYNYWQRTGGRIDNSPPYVNPDPIRPPSLDLETTKKNLKKLLDNPTQT